MKKLYTAPLLTVVAISVERGFAFSLSNNTEASTSLLGDDDHHDLSEARSVSTGWSKGGEDDFWDNTYYVEE